jgi:hypothetical protein
MPKHYANKRLTKLDSIFDQINNQDDDTTANNGTEQRSNRESTDTDSLSTQTENDVPE